MVVVEHVPSDINRIILVSTSRRHSRVIELPSFNSEGSDVTIEILPVKAGSGLQTNTARDEDVPSLEHVYESAFGRPMPERARLELNSADMDVDADGVPVPTLEHIRKQILGR